MLARSVVIAVVCAALACSKTAADDQPRREPIPYPQIITSEPPPKPTPKVIEVPAPMRPPHRDRSDPEKARHRKLYDIFDDAENDEVYEHEERDSGDQAFDTVMKNALDPLSATDSPSDDASPANEPRGRGRGALDEKPKREWRLTCKPHMVLRRAASNSAAPVARLTVGTKLTPLKHTDVDATAGWIQVDAGGGRRGFIIENATVVVTEGGEAAGYLECCGVDREADDEVEGLRERFDERVEYLDCLNKAQGEVGDGPETGNLAVARVVALGRAAELVVRSDKMEQPYKGFIQRYNGELAWDPEGYATKASDVWALEEKYHGEPAGDALAWQAAQYSASDRTCHHEVACAVSQARAYYGEYLKRYPNGVHASESCDAIAELRPRSATDERLDLDRNAKRIEECLATIDDLNGIIEQTHAVGRVQAQGTLAGLRRFVLARSGHLQTTR